MWLRSWGECSASSQGVGGADERSRADGPGDLTHSRGGRRKPEQGLVGTGAREPHRHGAGVAGDHRADAKQPQVKAPALGSGQVPSPAGPCGASFRAAGTQAPRAAAGRTRRAGSLKTTSLRGCIPSPSGSWLCPAQLTELEPVMEPDGSSSCNIRVSGLSDCCGYSRDTRASCDRCSYHDS